MSGEFIPDNLSEWLAAGLSLLMNIVMWLRKKPKQ